MDAGWTVPRKTVTEGGRDFHGRTTGWSRKVVKIERFTVDLCYDFNLVSLNFFSKINKT